jgi:hypothetical protein
MKFRHAPRLVLDSSAPADRTRDTTCEQARERCSGLAAAQFCELSSGNPLGATVSVKDDDEPPPGTTSDGAR